MIAILRATFLACLLASTAQAQDVTLTSTDGSIELSGSLIGFDGEFYRLESDYGPLTVSADGVRCAGPGCPDLQAFVAEIRFAGPASITRSLLPQIIETFALNRELLLSQSVAAAGPDNFTLTRSDGSVAARFFIETTTSDAAFLALVNDEADIALALREPLELERLAAEVAQTGGQPLSARGRVIGLDALVPITARSNPIGQVSLETLRAIFLGEIDNWAELGGPDSDIVLHLPETGSGLAQAFAEEMLTDPGARFANEIRRHDDLADLSDVVARDPFALGITTLSAVGNARALALSGSCGFAIAATANTLKSEDYPLTAPLFLFTGAARLPRLGRDFLAFFETAQAERVIRRAGYVSQSITRTPMEAQGGRLANAILSAGGEVSLADLQRLTARMATATRLSPTIRFSGGSSSFDTPSRSAISRLARAIEEGMFDGRTLVFVGFSDGDGGAAANLSLSRNRAEAVRRAVIEAAVAADLDRVSFRSIGFGEALPIACDESDWGAAINRRVEVWLE